MQRLAVLALVLAACGGGNGTTHGDDAGGDDTPDAPPADPDLLAQLQALPGVTVQQVPTSEGAYTYFVLHFTQPVDHADPGGPTFQQEVSLLHISRTAPMIVETDGYSDYTLDGRVELTQLLDANQISIEHRFFTPSIPDSPDWSKDTIANMAADEHAIVTALATIYTGPRIATGASKGGMTSVYYRSFFPDDVVGTVPYVAPQSFGAPDTAYDAFFTTIGPNATCRKAVRDAAVDMVKNHRAALIARAQADAAASGFTYTHLTIDQAFEISVASLEWAFWQYTGAESCGDVPTVGATDDGLYQFLERVSSVESNDDDNLDYFAPYYFQAAFQLGYPDTPIPYLDGLLTTDVNDLGPFVPAGSNPIYDGGAAMHAVDDFVQHDAQHMIFVYGQWDPWSGGSFALGDDADARDMHRFENPAGTHGSELRDLPEADREAAFARIAAWTGVTPNLAHHSGVRRPLRREPHLLHR